MSWALSFDRLATDHPAALELLGVAAHLAAEPVPFTLFTTHPDRLPPRLAVAAADPLAFTDLTKVLRQRALARVETDSLQLHRLVATLLRARLASDPDAPVSTTVALRLLRDAVPPDPQNNPATWPAWRQLLPHVVAITNETDSLTSADAEDAAWLLNIAATYLNLRGDPQPALPLAARAHDLYRALKGEDHPDTLVSASDLANHLDALGEYEQARVLAEDTLARRRRLFGEDHPETLASASDLAWNLGALGEYEQAGVLAEDTLARCRRVLGEDHPDTLASANGLAWNLGKLGKHEQVRPLAKDTFTRCRRYWARTTLTL